jgi:hypothetical protein
MLMMLPPPDASMPGSTAWIIQSWARTLRAKAASRSSSVACSAVPLWTMPAQLKRTSIAPIPATKAPMAALSRTSSRAVPTPAMPA